MVLRLFAGGLVSDSFDYPDGPLNQNYTSWLTHSGTTGEVQIANGCLILDQQCTEDISLDLAGGPYTPAQGALLFFKFTLRAEALPKNGYFAHFKDNSSGYRCRVFASTNEAPQGTYRLGISAGASTATNWHPAFLQLSETHVIALGYHVADAASQLWIDPETEASPSVLAGDSPTPIKITAFAFREAAGIGILHVDDLVVATSFADLFGNDPPPPSAPTFTIEPTGIVALEGEAATLSCSAAGNPPPALQWFKDARPLAGATNAILHWDAITLAQAGPYHVQATNEAGSATSRTVDVLVRALPVLAFTNRLVHPSQAGDALTNTFDELSLAPGETWRLTLQTSDPEARHLALTVATNTLPGVTVSWLTNSTFEWLGSLEFTPVAAHAGQTFHLSLEASNETAKTLAQWSIYVPHPHERGLVVTEFLANPTSDPAAPHFNPLQRATPSSKPAVEDEFIELCNTTGTDMLLDGWSLGDALMVRHIFTNGISLKPGEAIVVFGGPHEENPPGLPCQTAPASESGSGLSLNNTGREFICLRNPSGQLASRIVFEGSMLSATASLVRHPGFQSPFVPHDTISTLAVSPGLNWDGLPFENVPHPPPTIEAVRLLRPGSTCWRLEWQGSTGAVYSVWQTTNISGPFTSMATNISGGSNPCSFEFPVEDAPHLRFLRISSP